MRKTLDISTGIVDIAPGMFASDDLKVINYKGDNYYRACGETVIESLPDDGSRTSCVKPVGHIMSTHEDCYGHTMDRRYGVEEMPSKIRNHAHNVLRRTGVDEPEIFNILNALQCAGFTLWRGE